MILSNECPIEDNEQIEDRVHYSAAPTDASQAEIVDRGLVEYATRRTDVIAKATDRAREVLAAGEVAIAGHVLGEDVDAVAWVSGRR